MSGVFKPFYPLVHLPGFENCDLRNSFKPFYALVALLISAEGEMGGDAANSGEYHDFLKELKEASDRLCSVLVTNAHLFTS